MHELLPSDPGLIDEGALVDLANAIARRPDLWQPLVHHDENERHCVSLHADERLGVWVISWMPGQDTGYHDHAGSAGAVAVAKGEVREERPGFGATGRCVDAGSGQAFSFDVDAVHRVVAVGDGPAVTIHAYSPPLAEMGVYDVDEHGSVVRRTLRWDSVLAAA